MNTNGNTTGAVQDGARAAIPADVRAAVAAITDALEAQIQALRAFVGCSQCGGANVQADKVVTVEEAANALSKSKVTVLRYCKDGHLKPYKAPGAKLTTGVYLSSLNALMGA